MGQVLVLFPYAFSLAWLSERGIGVVVSPELPSAFEVIWQVIAFVLWEEIGFYYSHRLFHQPELYARFHK